MDGDVRAAIGRSHLRGLPPDVLDQLTTNAQRIKVRAGTVRHRVGDVAPHLELVVGGVIRVFVTAPDGRTMTVRYCRPGALVGVLTLFVPKLVLQASTQALVDADLLNLSRAVVHRAATRDAQVACALLADVSERASKFIDQIHYGAFFTVRQRVARHLLDLASEHVSGSAFANRVGRQEIIVAVSQGELAQAAGTVREVIVRVLRELREMDVVRTEHGRIVILDVARLVQDIAGT